MSRHKNKSFSALFYFRVPFQIIIIFVLLNEYHVYDKNKYGTERKNLFRIGGNHIVLWHNVIIMLLVVAKIMML